MDRKETFSQHPESKQSLEELIAREQNDEEIGYSVPEDQKGHKCNFCGKSFTEARHLKLHIHMVHDVQKDTKVLLIS